MASLFRQLHGPAATVTIEVDGRRLTVAAGDSVAAALLAAGIIHFRSSARHGAPRGPWCMIGTCFECLVEIDGAPNRQSCLIPVADGMRIRCRAPTDESAA